MAWCRTLLAVVIVAAFAIDVPGAHAQEAAFPIPTNEVQMEIMQGYLGFRHEKLDELDSYMVDDEVDDLIEDDWDTTCQALLDAHAEMKANYLGTIPLGETPHPRASQWMETEHASLVGICFDGSELAIAHNRMLEYAYWLAYEYEVAEDVIGELIDQADYLLDVMTDANLTEDYMYELLEALQLFKELDEYDERQLYNFEDAYNELLNSKSEFYRLDYILLARRLAYANMVENAHDMRDEYLEMAANAPATVQGEDFVREYYKSWLETFDDTLEFFNTKLDDYESLTESVRFGTFYQDEIESLEGQTEVKALSAYYDLALESGQPLMIEIRSHEER